MKPRILPLLLGLFLCGTPAPATENPAIPPDLLNIDRVEGPLSLADIALRLRVDPPGLFLWDLMRDADTLTNAQLRTLVYDLLRVRRFWHELFPADYILLDAWAQRDLPGATAAMLAIPDWEDSIEPIGDSDSDVENLAACLWQRLARTDLPYALELLSRLRGEETCSHIFSFVRGNFSLPPEKLPQFAAICQASTSPEAAGYVSGAVVVLAQERGPDTARAALQTLPESPDKAAATRELEKWIADPYYETPHPPPDISVVKFGSDTLATLALREADIPNGTLQYFAYPWAIVREVRKLSPDAALSLASQLTLDLRDCKVNPCPWLSWALCMRAAEGGLDATAAVADSLPPGKERVDRLSRLGPAFTSVRFALRTSDPDSEARIRALPPGPDREDAVAGFLARVDLAQADRWIALATDLKVPEPCWTPLLTRMAAAGEPEKALNFAAGLSSTDQKDPGTRPVLGIMEAWVLRDFPAAARYTLTAPDSPWGRSVVATFSTSLVLPRPAGSLPWLSPALLQHLADVDAWPKQPWWMWIVIEDPAAVDAWLSRYPGASQLSETQYARDEILASLPKKP